MGIVGPEVPSDFGEELIYKMQCLDFFLFLGKTKKVFVLHLVVLLFLDFLRNNCVFSLLFTDIFVRVTHWEKRYHRLSDYSPLH